MSQLQHVGQHLEFRKGKSFLQPELCRFSSLMQKTDEAVQDFLIIALFSLLRCFSGLRSSSSNGRADTSHRTGFMGAIGGRGRGHRNDPSGQRSPRDVDAENRLIDQLDEEWDD